MSNNILTKRRLPLSATAALLASIVAFAPAESQAGGYIGGSVGQSYVELNAGTPTVPEVFDEDDFGFKGFVGYDANFAVLNLGVELAYVNFGAPSGDVLGTQFELEVDGFAGFGVAGVDLGPVGVFAKYGVVSWDASITTDGVDAGSEDGSDPAYGVGLKFGVGSLEVRGEYEIFDIEDSDDVAMVSVGLVWRF